MNARLAKPIPAIWFIQARVVDLHQSLAAPLCLDFAFGCATICIAYNG
jgi:hypothetical protein